MGGAKVAPLVHSACRPRNNLADLERVSFVAGFVAEPAARAQLASRDTLVLGRRTLAWCREPTPNVSKRLRACNLPERVRR
jgi:hypothetical protein